MVGDKMKLAINGGTPVLKKPIMEKWIDITESDIEKVVEYLRNKPISIINGGVLDEFEKSFASYVGAKYAVAYCNGTAALHAASFACGANSNTNFISSIYSYQGTINSLLENNTRVTLVNYEKDFFTVDIDEVEKNITKDTVGILVTNCWGNLVDYEKLKKLKQKYDLKIIIDSSHSHGACYREKKVGSIECEDVVCFSFGKNKLISAGELGIAVTNDLDLYERLLFIGHPNRVPDKISHNMELKEYTNGIGNKYRPHPLAMVLALEQLKRFDKKIEKNISTNQYLINEISKIKGFYCVNQHKSCKRVFWKLQIFADLEYWKNVPLEKIVKALEAEGLTLQQFHNYNLEENIKLWSYERYSGQIINKSTLDSPNNVIVLPGYVDITKGECLKIVKIFKKISKNKEELM